MAITTKDILGTDSISASRITINDNTNTLKEALNDVLSMIDTSTGAFDNSTYGSINTVKTKGITVTTSGITVTAGNVALTAGDLDVQGGKISLQNIDLEYSTDGASKLMTIGGSGMIIPMAGSTTGFTVGSANKALLIYDTTANKLKFFNGTTWETVTSA